MICTMVLVGMTIHPKTTYLENGDITVNVCGFLVDHLVVQEIDTDVKTGETRVVYFDKNIRMTDYKVTISNENITLVTNKLFSDEGEEWRITFGEVTAIPRIVNTILISILYIKFMLSVIPKLYADYIKRYRG